MDFGQNQLCGFDCKIQLFLRNNFLYAQFEEYDFLTSVLVIPVEQCRRESVSQRRWSLSVMREAETHRFRKKHHRKSALWCGSRGFLRGFPSTSLYF